MNDVYIISLASGLFVGMAILLTAFFRRKKSEYLDEPKHRAFLIGAFLFFGVAFVCTMLLIFSNL
ncbi:hypothetical protein ACFRAU_11370 [Arthrobacter sp. NPDC056691]|uniref:hypothetical protein n=1 Tax=unclassified Arthrobacter TaxID=235627 RepID=UPI00366C13B0